MLSYTFDRVFARRIPCARGGFQSRCRDDLGRAALMQNISFLTLVPRVDRQHVHPKSFLMNGFAANGTDFVVVGTLLFCWVAQTMKPFDVAG